jgi:hypothetical protein
MLKDLWIYILIAFMCLQAAGKCFKTQGSLILGVQFLTFGVVTPISSTQEGLEYDGPSASAQHPAMRDVGLLLPIGDHPSRT